MSAGTLDRLAVWKQGTSEKQGLEREAEANWRDGFVDVKIRFSVCSLPLSSLSCNEHAATLISNKVDWPAADAAAAFGLPRSITRLPFSLCFPVEGYQMSSISFINCEFQLQMSDIKIIMALFKKRKKLFDDHQFFIAQQFEWKEFRVVFLLLFSFIVLKVNHILLLLLQCSCSAASTVSLWLWVMQPFGKRNNNRFIYTLVSFSFSFIFLLFFFSLSFHLTWMRSKSFVCEMSNHGRTHTHIRCTASLMLPYCNASPLDAYLIQIHFFSSSSLYSTISSLFVTGSNRRRKKKVLNSHANIFYKNLNCICHKNEMFQATTVIDRIRHFSLMFCAFFLSLYIKLKHIYLLFLSHMTDAHGVWLASPKKKKK